MDWVVEARLFVVEAGAGWSTTKILGQWRPRVDLIESSWTVVVSAQPTDQPTERPVVAEVAEQTDCWSLRCWPNRVHRFGFGWSLGRRRSAHFAHSAGESKY